jgi:hypothetical protein
MRNLLTAALSRDEAIELLDIAEDMDQIHDRDQKKLPALRGRTVVNLFFEDSTRTRTSFTLAARRLGADVIDVVTSSGITIARHRLAADGTGVMVRDHGHVYALEQAAMAGANTGRPHRRKERIPPGPDALAAAATLRRTTTANRALDENHSTTTQSDSTAVLYDLSVYERAARGRNTLS